MANKSGININPKNKGKFSAKAKKAGMSTQAFAKHVKAHPNNYSGKTRQQANFARVSKTKFKHQTGGPLLADFGQHDQQSISGQFPTIDANYDPLDNLGPHAETPGSMSAMINNSKSFINTQTGQKMQSRYAPYVKGVNMAMSAATDIGNSINDNKLKREEYLQTVKSMTPKFMTNTNQGGLNNSPAYTMYGGDDRSFATMETGGELDYMMVGGVTPGQYDYSNKSNEDYGHEGIAHNAFYGDQSIYAAGGNVSSDKAKEILRDGTVHGHPLTDKQKRYFGWIAGGKKMMGGSAKYQTGGAIPTGQDKSNLSPEEYYQASAKLAYYKDKLNAQLKSKNPQAYGDYFKGLQGARTSGQKQGFDYIQNSQYNDYLSPDEVKKTLGSDKDYQNYLNSLNSVNSYNVKQGQQPLWGDVEGQNDPSKLNYGRRFASLQMTPSFSNTVINPETKSKRDYSRQYQYNPQTGQVEFTETGDASLRPEGFSVPPQQQTSTVSRQYGGPRDIRNERESFSYYRGAKNGGYAVGDEVELSTAEIAQLKKQGYKLKFV